MDLFQEHTILTVGRLTALLRGVIEENFFQVWVEGEVSNLATPASGHCYFSLKDNQATLRCVMFKSSVQALKFALANGDHLILRGRVTVYDQRGDYQLIVEYAEPKGLGALQAAFIQLKEKLEQEGLFEQSRKKSIPLLPQRIGVVTSATGAAFQDICTVLKRRHAGIPIIICPVRVQGQQAAQEIETAIDLFNQYAAVDVLIVGRGGGSIEDLWPFNEERVARAIARSQIPVISAVGHETDWTIADFVADIRAATPSAAAELVSAGRLELLKSLSHLKTRLDRAIDRTVTGYRKRHQAADRALVDPSRILGYLAQRTDDMTIRLHQATRLMINRLTGRLQQASSLLTRHHPALVLTRRRVRLDQATATLERLLTSTVEQRKLRLVKAISSLESLSPLKTLGRGYSIVEKVADRKIIRDASRLSPGDVVRIRMARGAAVCAVDSIDTEEN